MIILPAQCFLYTARVSVSLKQPMRLVTGLANGQLGAGMICLTLLLTLVLKLVFTLLEPFVNMERKRKVVDRTDE